MALQMTWQQPSVFNHKRKTPLGLRNLGNTCYLNSVLQCLTYTPPLAQFCLKSQHSSSCDSALERDKKSECPFCILEKQISRSLIIEQAQDTPVRIHSCLRVFADHFRSGRQEDAHEFLRYVIDACHNSCLRLKKMQQWRKGGGNAASGDGTVVKEIFGGALQSQVKCLSCHTESNKVDDIMDISLDVLHSSSLKEALQKFFQPEILDGNNKYKCDNCKKLVTARKQMSILQAPNVLVIQLKRFEGIFGGKIDKTIGFEEVLVLSSYMSRTSQDPHPEYKLFGTIVHSGFTPDSGHYYAYIKDVMGRWYCCNDTFVSLATLQEVLSEKVYILFFSRTKQRPLPTNRTLASNGVNGHECFRNDTSKSSMAFHPVKAADGKKLVDSSLMKDNVTTIKVDKIPCNPLKKQSEKSGAIYPANGRTKVVDKRESKENNGIIKTSVFLQKREKNLPSIVDRIDVPKSKLVDAVNGEKIQPFPLANGNGHMQNGSVYALERGQSEENGAGNVVEKENRTNQQALQNGGVDYLNDFPVLKRKLHEENSCILFAKDAQSFARVEEFKEVLGKEASLALRSCGWFNGVQSVMRSRKKLCLQESANGELNINDTKRLLIADARRTSISQIPESLKENLVARLRLFSQEKQHSGS